MSLEEYWRRRDFAKTTEPRGKIHSRKNKRPIYVIQKHDASHLHYDLRLEMDGVLKSWAIPKEPPVSVGVKRLAVQTEDHPIEYAEFEGIIPEGQYGAGIVEIWDKGSFELIDRKEDKITMIIYGKKLIGKYHLIKLKGSNKNWLFFKSPKQS
ncbi:MAG: DNA polymerase ligase N-terminal domain-containing protein [Candidatus Odinarchaeia archaeon]